MTPSRLNVLCCAVLTWCASWRPPRRSYRTYYTYRTPSDEHFKPHKVKIQKKRERAVPAVHHARVSKRMIYGQTQRGHLFKHVKQQKSERKLFFIKKIKIHVVCFSIVDSCVSDTEGNRNLWTAENNHHIRCRNSIQVSHGANNWIVSSFLFLFFLRMTTEKRRCDNKMIKMHKLPVSVSISLDKK